MSPPELREKPSTLDRLAGIPPERIRQRPRRGTATEEDLLEPENAHCELIDGTLVEKAMGARESLLELYLSRVLDGWVRPRRLGLIYPASAVVRLMPGCCRAPDVGFYAWDDIPGRQIPEETIPDLVPRLAVEVLSVSNRPGEMQAKRRDYFDAGTRIVWEIDPRSRTIMVYIEPDVIFQSLRIGDGLDGGDVLPGFEMSLADLFAELDVRG